MPQQVAANSRKTPEGAEWLAALPELIRDLVGEWSLKVEGVYDSDDVTASWVAPVRLATGLPAVLKIGLPHMEAEHEIHGLRLWGGGKTVRLLDSDVDRNAMLLERCVPGTSLRKEPEPKQDRVIAALLRQLWRSLGPGASPFRPLSRLLSLWSSETLRQRDSWPDEALVRAGLALFKDLSRESSASVLLATDLHAGNVLRAERDPWLVIDPKPFVGDPAYDATQHLLNCPTRMLVDPLGTIEHFAGELEVDAERVRLWMLARTSAEPRDEWDHGWKWTVARSLSN